MIRGFTIPVHHLVFETLHLGKQFIFLKNPIKTLKFKKDFRLESKTDLRLESKKDFRLESKKDFRQKTFDFEIQKKTFDFEIQKRLSKFQC